MAREIPIPGIPTTTVRAPRVELPQPVDIGGGIGRLAVRKFKEIRADEDSAFLSTKQTELESLIAEAGRDFENDPDGARRFLENRKGSFVENVPSRLRKKVLNGYNLSANRAVETQRDNQFAFQRRQEIADIQDRINTNFDTISQGIRFGERVEDEDGTVTFVTPGGPTTGELVGETLGLLESIDSRIDPASKIETQRKLEQLVARAQTLRQFSELHTVEQKEAFLAKSETTPGALTEASHDSVLTEMRAEIKRDRAAFKATKQQSENAVEVLTNRIRTNQPVTTDQIELSIAHARALNPDGEAEEEITELQTLAVLQPRIANAYSQNMTEVIGELRELDRRREAGSLTEEDEAMLDVYFGRYRELMLQDRTDDLLETETTVTVGKVDDPGSRAVDLVLSEEIAQREISYYRADERNQLSDDFNGADVAGRQQIVDNIMTDVPPNRIGHVVINLSQTNPDLALLLGYRAAGDERTASLILQGQEIEAGEQRDEIIAELEKSIRPYMGLERDGSATKAYARNAYQVYKSLAGADQSLRPELVERAANMVLGVQNSAQRLNGYKVVPFEHNMSADEMEAIWASLTEQDFVAMNGGTRPVVSIDGQTVPLTLDQLRNALPVYGENGKYALEVRVNGRNVLVGRSDDPNNMYLFDYASNGENLRSRGGDMLSIFEMNRNATAPQPNDGATGFDEIEIETQPTEQPRDVLIGDMLQADRDRRAADLIKIADPNNPGQPQFALEFPGGQITDRQGNPVDDARPFSSGQAGLLDFEQLRLRDGTDVVRVQNTATGGVFFQDSSGNRIEAPQDLSGAITPDFTPTADQSKVAGFASRIQNSEQVFSELLGEDFDPTGVGTRIGRGLLNLPGGALLVGEQTERQDQAERDFINAVLRRESGAAIAKTEFDNAAKQYFPRAGDSAATLRQKALNRRIVQEAFKREAGQAFDPQLAALADQQLAAVFGLEAAIPQDHLDLLRNNPTPQMRTFFDEAYGEGTAEEILGKKNPNPQDAIPTDG